MLSTHRIALAAVAALAAGAQALRSHSTRARGCHRGIRSRLPCSCRCARISRSDFGRVKCNVLPKPPVAAAADVRWRRNGLMDLSFTRTATRRALRAHRSAGISLHGRHRRSHRRGLPAHLRAHARQAGRAQGRGRARSIHPRPRPDVHTQARDQYAERSRWPEDPCRRRRRHRRYQGARRGCPLLKPAPSPTNCSPRVVADGVFFPKEAPASFKLIPLIKHATIIPGGCTTPASYGWRIRPMELDPASRPKAHPASAWGGPRPRSGRAWDAADAKGLAAMKEANIPRSRQVRS